MKRLIENDSMCYVSQNIRIEITHYLLNEMLTRYCQRDAAIILELITTICNILK